MACRSVITAAVLWLLTLTVYAAQPMTCHNARQIIDQRAADPIAGIWRMGGDGATVAILPSGLSSDRFDIYLLDSPDMSVIPGAKIGAAAATGAVATYDAEFVNDRSLTKKRRRYIMTLQADGQLAFKSYNKGKRIALWRWIPYLFRVSVYDNNTRPASADGAVRVYPPATKPRYTIL